MPDPDSVPAADLPPGTMRRVGDWAVGNRGAGPDGDDRYFAVSRRCRHQLADLAEGTIDATITTNFGDIGLTLDAASAPCTVNSFVSLAEQGFFDDSPCPRMATAAEFGILQCGDPTGTGSGGPGYSYADELTGEETYDAGTLAMANAGPDTNGSQFFLVYEDTQLPPSYAVLGTMDDAGTEVVREVGRAGAQGGAPDGPPATEVTIESVSVG